MNRILALAFMTSSLFATGCPGPEEDPAVDEQPPPLNEACTATNCTTGCCDLWTNKCITTRGTEACGLNGSTCSKCASGMVCHPSRQECITPVIRTRVRAVRATLAAVDPSDDSNWDLDGSPPDVVVELSCPKADPLVSRTEEIESLAPQWTQGGCDVLAQDLLTAPILFKVFDVDAFFDDEITTAQYQLTQTNLEQRSVDLRIPEAVTSLVFQLDTYLAE